MKRFIISLLCLCGFVLTLSAQEENEKAVVYVEYFSNPKGLDRGLVEVLRNNMIQGIQETNRVVLVDVASQSSLANEETRRKVESAMADVTARTAEMRTLGAQYIITGEVTSMATTRQTLSSGSVYYKGSVHWTIKVIDAATGTLKATKSFAHEGLTGSTGDTQNAAIASTCSYAKISMEDFVDDTFPIEGLILKVESTSKKNDKAETVYIDLGSSRGIAKKQKFTVYLEVDIAGELSRKEIGSLSAQEVLSAKRTLCKVTKGGDKVLEAVKEGQKLVVVSRKERTFLDKI